MSIQLNFGNLPLHEVVARAWFQPSFPFGFRVVNSVAEQLKSHFSKLTEPKIWRPPPWQPLHRVPDTPGPVAGAVYEEHEQGLRVSLQGNLIAVHWTKSAKENAPAYPRFPAVERALWQTFDALENAVDELPPVRVMNMDYANFIEARDSATVLHDYFSDKMEVKALEGAQEAQHVEVAWRGADGVDLRFKLNAATTQFGQEKRTGFRLLTAAGVLLEESHDRREALANIHERLQVFFKSVISDRAEREWKLEVDNG